MRTETGFEENSCTTAGDTRQYLLPSLHARCIEAPHRKPIMRFPAVSAFFASLLIHTCVIAGSVLLSRTFPPTVLPVGESIEVTLVALRMPASGSQSSGSHTATPIVMPEKTETENSVAQGPSSAARRDAVVSTVVQPRKNGRAIRKTQEQAFEKADNVDFGEDAQPAGNGQHISGGGTRHGHARAGNGNLPVPFGAHINPWPVYPEIARQRGQEGQVALLVNVDIHGNPAQVSLEASSGYALLDQEAIKAIRRWKFNPASYNGEAVPGTVRVPVTFRLQ